MTKKSDIPVIYGSIGHYKDINVRTIDLRGPDGNAYFIMGKAIKLAKDRGMDYRKIMSEMQEGDYENLLRVFERYFGDEYKLIR